MGKKCKVIELRSGKELPCPYTSSKTGGEEQKEGYVEENEDRWVEVLKPIRPPVVPKYVSKLPFPQRQQRNKLNQKFQEFLNILKKLTINIPFAEALEQTSSYVKLIE